MNKMKNFITKPATIVCSILIIVLILLWELGEGHWYKYYDGIFTELIGIIITVVFVQCLFDRKALTAEKQQELEQIQKFHRVLQKYIQEYTFYFNCVTTPIGARNNQSEEMNDDFNFSDIRDLYMPSLSMRNGFIKPSIRCFYQYEQEIKNYMIAILTHTQLKHYKEIERLFLKFITASINGDFSDTILMNEKNKSVIDTVIDIIKNKSDEYIEGFENRNPSYISNMVTPYYVLYNLLIEERNIIKEYQTLISLILD